MNPYFQNLFNTGRWSITRPLALLALVFTFTMISLQLQAKGFQRTLGSQVSVKPQKGSFALIENDKPAFLVYSSDEYPGVVKALNYFKSDLQMVSGTEAILSADQLPEASQMVISCTIGHSKLIDQLIKEKTMMSNHR